MVIGIGHDFYQFVEKITMSHVKEALLELAKDLPDECTWDDVMYRIYVHQKIEAGLKDAEEGRLIPHEEVFKEFEQQ
jgi:predicted transcriptional regulator